MKKVRVVNKKNLSTMIVGVVTIAIVVVCVFLYVSRPTEIDKLSQSYLDTVDVEKLQKKVETSFDGSYRLSDYLVYGETLSLYRDEYGTNLGQLLRGDRTGDGGAVFADVDAPVGVFTAQVDAWEYHGAVRPLEVLVAGGYARVDDRDRHAAAS